MATGQVVLQRYTRVQKRTVGGNDRRSGGDEARSLSCDGAALTFGDGPE
jgi:hypothetical protein